VDDAQFYEKGITIVGGMKSFAPEGVEVEYMKGFDINGVDENMGQVLEAAKDYDAIVVCIGEHVYSECEFIIILS
jgi:beta-glucosidase